MLKYQEMNTAADTPIGEPGDLPDCLVGLSDADLANLNVSLNPNAREELGFTDRGYVPVDVEPPAPPVVVSVYDFLLLFTTAERVAIRQAATQEPALADWLDLLNRVANVHMDDPNTVEALTMLTTAGLLGAGRQVEVLANQPPLG